LQKERVIHKSNYLIFEELQKDYIYNQQSRITDQF